MSDIFVCYSRKDKEFVRRLCNALTNINRDSWVDWKDIPLTAEWLEDAYLNIESANAFAFILSPDSIVSNVCRLELAHAVKHNKRLMPIVYRDVDPNNTPPELATRNWIFCREHDDFSEAFQSLIKALDTDLEYVSAHTHWLRRAIEWDTKTRDNSLLLRGLDLQSAVKFFVQTAPRKEPEKPTPLQSEYIHASQEWEAQETQRWKQLYENAERERKMAFSRELAANALARLEADPELSVLLASEAVKLARTAESEWALRASLLTPWPFLTLHSHTRVGTIAASPDGQLVAATSDETATVWDTSTGNALFVLQGQGRMLWAMFSPGGEYILTSSLLDHTVQLSEARTGRQVLLVQGHTDSIDGASFSPDGRYVVTHSSDKTARVFEIGTGKTIAELRGHGRDIESKQRNAGGVTGASFSSDGRLIVTASTDKTARVWEPSDGKTVARLCGHTDGVNSAVFSPDSTLVLTASDDGVAKVWEATSGRAVVTLLGHDSKVGSAQFSPDGSLIVTASWDGTARVWETQTGQSVATLRAHNRVLSRAAFSPNGRFVLTVGLDETARVWDTSTWAQVAVLPKVSDAKFSLDGRFVFTIRGNVAQVWKSSFWQSLVELRGHQGTVYHVAFSPCGKFVATASDDQTARVWDSGNGKSLKEFRRHDGLVASVDFSPDGTLLLTAGNRTARVWKISTGKSLAVFRERNSYHAAFSPNGRLVVTTSFKDRVARVWRVKTGRVISKLHGHAHFVHWAAFSPDSKLVVTACSDGTGRIWDVRSARKVVELTKHNGEMRTAAFSADGSHVVTASFDNTARVWDASTGRSLTELHEQGPVYCANFSPNGNFIVTASTVARIWERSSGRMVATLHGGYAGAVSSAAFSPDGKLIVVASDSTAQIHSAEVYCSVDELFARASRRSELTGRRLTPEERQSYLHEPA